VESSECSRKDVSLPARTELRLSDGPWDWQTETAVYFERLHQDFLWDNPDGASQ